ncbi:MAG: amidohydrolase family protein, partial [Albidovulum sp.]|uniref:amidohydrolase family protein n=1 Tax=Albidovulum sp. TaxID=1872424 RepID=UPI00132148E3
DGLRKRTFSARELAEACIRAMERARSLNAMITETADRALAMATSVPARVAGLGDRSGALAPGRQADFVHLSDGLELRGVWQRGVRLA